MAGYTAAISTASITSEPGTASEPAHLLVTHAQAGKVEIAVDRLSGGHLLHLAVAGCVFNCLHFGAADRGITIEHARVVADGGFNEDGTQSTGIRLDIEVIADAPQDEIKSLVDYAAGDSAVAHILTHPTTVQLGRVEARST